MSSGAAIQLEDVSSILEDSDSDIRVEVLQKVSEQYGTDEFSKDQRKLAEQIFRVLMHDAESKVRQALSITLKDNNAVPKDIVLQLVEDIDDVAVPMLQFSEVLTDDDLVEIIKNTDKESEARLMAISDRKEVHEGVSDALVDKGNKNVMKNMISRAAVKFSEMTMGKMVDNYANDADMMEGLSKREELPATIVEKVITKIGTAMQEQLVEKYGHIVPNLSEVVEKSQEAATLKVMGMKSSEKEIKHMVEGIDKTTTIAQEIYEQGAELTEIVEKLEASGRLTPVSALCMGNLELFEISVARITNIPVSNIRKLILDPKGFQAVYDKAKLPESICDAVKLVIKVIRDMDKEAEEDKSIKKTANSLISRILMAAEAEEREVENLSYFISMIHQHAKLLPSDEQL